MSKRSEDKVFKPVEGLLMYNKELKGTTNPSLTEMIYCNYVTSINVKMEVMKNDHLSHKCH